MALFGFGTKKEPPPPPEPLASIPTEEVLRLRQQGLNNAQIVQALQRAGYRPNQIFDAMNQADLQPASPAVLQPEPATLPPEQGYEPSQEATAEPQPDVSEKLEELAEAIIEEKWQELLKNVNKIVEWKEKIEGRMTTLEQQFADLKENFNTLNRGVLDKISEYDQNITSVGTEIKAMEQVFQKVLPTFTDGVNELSRITRTMKKSSK